VRDVVCYDAIVDQEAIKRQIEEEAREGRLTCEQARAVAERLEVAYSEVGRACDELNVKIKACQLGCF